MRLNEPPPPPHAGRARQGDPPEVDAADKDLWVREAYRSSADVALGSADVARRNRFASACLLYSAS